MYWYLAPTYKQAKQIAWRILKEIIKTLPEEIIGKINESELSAEIGSSLIQLKGCEDSDALRGNGLSGMVIDEAAFIEDFEEKWSYALRPALADREGFCIFASTPCGFNYFYDLYNKYSHYNFSSHENEFLPMHELDEMKQEMNEIQYKQEIMAEFLPQGSYQYFQGIDRVIQPDLNMNPVSGHTYLIGCDIARHHDSTVLIAIDQENNAVSGYDSFDDIEWSVQKYRIANFARKYNNGQIVIDATNNSSIGEDLMNDGIAVEQFIFTPRSKVEIYEKLRIYIQNGNIFLPKIEKLIRELNKFEFRLEATMRLGVQAEHDDCVAALALAVKNLNTPDVIINQRRVWSTR
jgi:phage FluMu gp28-like protein